MSILTGFRSSNSRLKYFSQRVSDFNADLEKALEDSDVIIRFESQGYKDGKKNVSKLASFINEDKKILIFEQLPEEGEMGGGGGGDLLPSLSDVIIYSLIIVINNITGGFFQEFGKEAYKKFSRQIGDIIKNAKYRQSMAIRIAILGRKDLEYIFQESLTADQAVDAFQKIGYHSKVMSEKLKEKVGTFRFLYDRDSKNWINLD